MMERHVGRLTGGAAGDCVSLYMVGSGCPILLSVISHQKTDFFLEKKHVDQYYLFTLHTSCVFWNQRGYFFTFELKDNLKVKTLKIFPQKYLNNSLSEPQTFSRQNTGMILQTKSFYFYLFVCGAAHMPLAHVKVREHLLEVILSYHHVGLKD